VGHDDGGDAELLLQLSQFHLHRFAQFGVERRHRFVKQEQTRRKCQRTRDCNPLLLPARKLCDRPFPEARKVDQRKQLFHLLLLLGPRRPSDPQRIGDVLADVEMREQRQRLENHAEIALVRRNGSHIDPVEQYRTGVRLLQPGNHPQQRGLAAAGRPQQTHEGAVRNTEIDVFDCREVAKPLCHVPELQSRHRIDPLRQDNRRPALGGLPCGPRSLHPAIISVHF
jgi:hypothetical protein